MSFGRASGQIHTDGGRTSPPNQISSSASTTSSQQQLIIGVSDTFGGQAAQTNWNTQSQPATPQQFCPMFGQGVASNRSVAGSQSFQGDASVTGSETNFAYALERPGVVPVVNAFGNSVASQSTAASLQSVSTGPCRVCSSDTTIMAGNPYMVTTTTTELHKLLHGPLIKCWSILIARCLRQVVMMAVFRACFRVKRLSRPTRVPWQCQR